jgi:hypothetical protein
MALLKVFRYTIRDKEFCHGENEVVVDYNSTVILGERDDWMIWDDHCKGYRRTKAFMINFQGIEYGTEKPVDANFSSCNPCDDPRGPFQIFEPQFEKQFE